MYSTRTLLSFLVSMIRTGIRINIVDWKIDIRIVMPTFNSPLMLTWTRLRIEFIIKCDIHGVQMELV